MKNYVFSEVRELLSSRSPMTIIKKGLDTYTTFEELLESKDNNKATSLTTDKLSQAIERCNKQGGATGIPAIPASNKVIVRFNINQSITTLLSEKIDLDKILNIRVAAYGNNVKDYNIGDSVVLSEVVGKTLNSRFVYIDSNKREPANVQSILKSLEKEDIMTLRNEFKGFIQIVAYAVIDVFEINYITYS